MVGLELLLPLLDHPLRMLVAGAAQGQLLVEQVARAVVARGRKIPGALHL
jgi:hypothetical protein